MRPRNNEGFFLKQRKVALPRYYSEVLTFLKHYTITVENMELVYVINSSERFIVFHMFNVSSS